MSDTPNTGSTTSKTPAQRQAARRHKLRVQEHQCRLNVWIDASACNALRRLARRDAVTQRQCLERLLRQAEDHILCTLDLDSPEWEAYFQIDRRASPAPDNPRPKGVQNDLTHPLPIHS